MNGLLSALGKLSYDESSVIQILLQPTDDDWQDRIKKLVKKSEKGKKKYFSLNPLRWIMGLIDLFTR